MANETKSCGHFSQLSSHQPANSVFHPSRPLVHFPVIGNNSRGVAAPDELAVCQNGTRATGRLKGARGPFTRELEPGAGAAKHKVSAFHIFHIRRNVQRIDNSSRSERGNGARRATMSDSNQGRVAGFDASFVRLYECPSSHTAYARNDRVSCVCPLSLPSTTFRISHFLISYRYT